MVKNSKNKKASFVNATLITTMSLIITRIISVAYMIPFTAMVKDDAMTIHNYAMPIFSQFYELSLAGMPLAIARLVAMYNAKEQYKTSNRVLQYAQRFMLASGVLLGVSFFVLSGVIARAELAAGQERLLPDLVRMMRIIAPALIILPFMSGMRGYLQGFRTVSGPALSQVAERFVFVVVMLFSLYIGLYQLNIPATQMIGYASIAQPIASLSAVFVLLPFYRSIRKEHHELMTEDTDKAEHSKEFLMKQILLTAIPFVIAGFASTSYMSITALTYTHIRGWAGIAISQAGMEYNIIAYYTNKLVSIPLTFSLAMAGAIISFVTLSFEGGDMASVRNYVKKSYRMIIFTTFGAVILMALLAKPLLTFFYGYDPDYNGVVEQVLIFDGFRGVFFALETISISLLQALGKKNRAVAYTVIGPIVKLVLTIPLVYYFGIYGEILSVIIGLSVVIGLATNVVLRMTDVKSNVIVKAFLATLLCTLPGVIFLIVANTMTNTFAPALLQSRVTAFGYLAIVGTLALIISFIAAERTGFLRTIFDKDIKLGDLVNRFSRRTKK